MTNELIYAHVSIYMIIGWMCLVLASAYHVVSIQVINRTAMCILLIMVLFLCIPSYAVSLDKPMSWNKAQKTVINIWYPLTNGRDLYCNCKYSAKTKTIDVSTCNYKPGSPRGKRIEIEHIVPVSWFKKSTTCRNRQECVRVDPLVRKQLVDLHNLIPVVGEINGRRSDLPYGVIDTDINYNGCPMEVSKSVVEPNDEIKGIISRATLYMLDTYGIIGPKGYREMMNIWNKAYPVKECEREANEQIKERQGTTNKVIEGQ